MLALTCHQDLSKRRLNPHLLCAQALKLQTRVSETLEASAVAPLDAFCLASKFPKVC